MAESIKLPSMPQGSPERQLEQLYSYLYQTAVALNVNLKEIGNAALTDEEQQLMNQMTAAIEEPGTIKPAYNYAEAETLKSLIIKTAQFVKNEVDNYRLILFGEESAEGSQGNWKRKKGLRVDVTPDGVQQTYSYAEIIKGLKTFEINAKNYIKTGLLRTEGGLPVYGVAIGKDVVTFAEDGTETYNDGNKVAELTADELAFYQNNVKLASYKGSGVTFYQGGVRRMLIDSNGVTIYNGNTKLAELLNTALKFYYNGILRTQIDSDGVKLQNVDETLQVGSTGVTMKNGINLLAEILNTALKFYYNGTLRAQMDADGVKLQNGNETLQVGSNGVTMKNGNNLLAEILNTALKFYYNGTLRTQMDTDGVLLQNGNEKLQVGSNGITMLNGDTKLAEILNTALNFYYSGSLRAQYDSNGISFYNGKTKLAELLTTGLKFYHNGSMRAQYDSEGVSIYNGNALMMMITDSRIGFYNNGSEIMYITGGNIYATQNLNIGSNREVKIGNLTIDGGGLNLDVSWSEGSFIYEQHICFGVKKASWDNCIGLIASSEHTYNMYDTLEFWTDRNVPDLVLNKSFAQFETDKSLKPYQAGQVSLGSPAAQFNTVYCNAVVHPSSRERKEQIKDLECYGEKLDRLRPVSFVYKEDSTKRRTFGLIHEETVSIMPEICEGTMKDPAVKKAIRYEDLIPILLKEIQDLRKRVRALEAGHKGGNENGN